MSGQLDGVMNTAIQALAVFGAVTLLVILFVGVLVVRASAIPSGPTAEKHLIKTINRQYLFFSAAVIAFATSLLLGVMLPVAFAAGVAVYLLFSRLLLPTLMVLGGMAILYLLLEVFVH
jgi:hypothetical protein